MFLSTASLYYSHCILCEIWLSWKGTHFHLTCINRSKRENFPMAGKRKTLNRSAEDLVVQKWTLFHPVPNLYSWGLHPEHMRINQTYHLWPVLPVLSFKVSISEYLCITLKHFIWFQAKRPLCWRDIGPLTYRTSVRELLPPPASLDRLAYLIAMSDLVNLPSALHNKHTPSLSTAYVFSVLILTSLKTWFVPLYIIFCWL